MDYGLAPLRLSHFLYGKPNFFPDFDHTYVGISIALIAK